MDLELDSTNWDLIIENGDLKMVDTIAAIDQHLTQRLKTFLGEWFLDVREGVPYFQYILVKNPDPVVVDTLFKNEIINTPGVLELLTFGLDINSTRLLKLTFKARTNSGVLDFTKEIP